MITEILLVCVLVLLVILIFLVLKSKGIESEDVQIAISEAWIRMGLDRTIGELTTHANDIRESYRSFERMLRVPTERGSFGELSLETILSDQLPPDMFGIRKRILNGKIPDAYIRSTVGIICVDSKFSLDNYRKMLETEDPIEKKRFRTTFIKDIQNQLDKIAEDYVCPEKGSAEFAFAYIPVESIFYFLETEEAGILIDYTKKGVQVVSPLTLSQRIGLIKAGVYAKKLSEEAEKIRKDISTISQGFEEVDKKWQVFYNTHLKNAEIKAEELDDAYKRLREEFSKISKISKE